MSRTSTWAVTAASTVAAECSSRRNRSHWRGPSTRSTVVPGHLERRAGLGQVDHHRALGAVAGLDAVHRAVLDHPAVVDHHEPLAQPLHVDEVVGRQQHRRPVLAVQVAEEGADRLLRDDVEPDGRLVEEEHRRAVEHGGGELAPHPLAERQLAHRRGRGTGPCRAARPCGPSVTPWSAAGTRYTWRSSSNESDSGRSHHSWVRWPNTTPMRRATAMRSRLGSMPSTRTGAPARHEDADQHLDGRRLPGAVRADVADHRAGVDGEVDAVDRPHLPLAPAHAAGPLVDGERLADVGQLDERGSGHGQLPVLRWWRSAVPHTARAIRADASGHERARPADRFGQAERHRLVRASRPPACRRPKPAGRRR